jgi:hypothetical protein
MPGIAGECVPQQVVVFYWIYDILLYIEKTAAQADSERKYPHDR